MITMTNEELLEELFQKAADLRKLAKLLDQELETAESVETLNDAMIAFTEAARYASTLKHKCAAAAILAKKGWHGHG